MGINVSGENARLWISERQTKDGGTFKDYTVSVSGKFDEEWKSAYQKVRFKKDIDLTGVENGAKFNFKGFMTINKPWTNKDGKEIKDIVIMITEADFEDSVGFAEVKEPVPF